jgi:hypothetical protein
MDDTRSTACLVLANAMQIRDHHGPIKKIQLVMRDQLGIGF